MTAHRAIINTGMQGSTATIKAALDEVWSTNKMLDFKAIMADLVAWERTNRTQDRLNATKRQQLRDAAAPSPHVGKQGGGAAGGNPSGNPRGGSGGGLSGTGGGAINKAAQSQLAALKSGNTTITPAAKSLCIAEILNVLKFGKACRNSTSSCAYAHVRSYNEAITITGKTKDNLQNYILAHVIVQAKKKTDPNWYKSLATKLASM
jgi:hypothetical protein